MKVRSEFWAQGKHCITLRPFTHAGNVRALSRLALPRPFVEVGDFPAPLLLFGASYVHMQLKGYCRPRQEASHTTRSWSVADGRELLKSVLARRHGLQRAFSGQVWITECSGNRFLTLTSSVMARLHLKSMSKLEQSRILTETQDRELNSIRRERLARHLNLLNLGLELPQLPWHILWGDWGCWLCTRT